MNPVIKFRDGYKYQLAETYEINTGIIGYTVDTEFIKLTPVGILTIKSGYAWDGPSGPTHDTLDSMRGSLVHDALYQLMRWGLLPFSERGYVDLLFKNILLEDGMNEVRAGIWYAGVSRFAGEAARPESRKEIFIAPVVA